MINIQLIAGISVNASAATWHFNSWGDGGVEGGWFCLTGSGDFVWSQLTAVL
jgi:hypothetical protein